MTREAPSWPPGTPPFGPASALSLGRALRAACVDPALSAGERDRGRLVPGSARTSSCIPAAALREPVETGGRPVARAARRLVLVDGEAGPTG